jgi:hypothetical protein
MSTVKDWWSTFEKLVLQPNASKIQREEMRRSFYAGFYSCIETSAEIANICGDDDEQGAAAMDALRNECLAFARGGQMQ